MYYHAKVFTATATGKQLNTVRCDKCSREFFYELSRIAKGQASAPYGVGQASAQHRAEKAAKKNLADKLRREVELVPCPACRWVNAAAIDRFRRRKCRGWNIFALVVLFLALAIDFIIYMDMEDLLGRQPNLREPILWILALAALSLAAAGFVMQRFLRSAINPNAQVNGRPTIPVGTPPALLKEALPDGGERLVPVPSEFSNLQTDAAWAIFRPGQLVLEPLCCECLEPAATVFKLPLASEGSLHAPLCHPCQGKLSRQFWWRMLVSLPLAALAGWLIARVCPGMDEAGANVLACVLGFLGVLVGYGVIVRQLRPYRLRALDKARGISKISFRNPAYTALLIRKIGQADGLYQTAGR